MSAPTQSLPQQQQPTKKPQSSNNVWLTDVLNERYC